jgi:hypothetical protein
MRHSRFLGVLEGPLQVGVSLQPEGWHVVLQEPGLWAWWPTHATSRPMRSEPVQYRSLSSDALPDLMSMLPGLTHGANQADQMSVWRAALQALQDLIPKGVGRLILSWPDELLWSGVITLSGPLSDTEVPDLLEQELSVVLPVPIDRVAWDAQPVVQTRQASVLRFGWHTLLTWLGFARAPSPTQWEEREQDVAWQCWAMPRELAHQIGLVGTELGWYSVQIEPRSVSVQRATTTLAVQADKSKSDHGSRWDGSPEVLAAWGAALPQAKGAPNLLRELQANGWRRMSLLARGWWPWLLAWGLTAAAGYALGGVQQQRWAREQEAWTQRWRELQVKEQAHQAHRQAGQQAQRRQLEHEAQVAHNLRFAQVLQDWAATVPEGVQWQQLSLRPQLIDLQGQALSTESFARWMDRWSQALPPGGQHHLQWQSENMNRQQARPDAHVGVRVQLTWNPGLKGHP